MTATTFNTFAYFEKLKSAGMPEQQAKVQAEALFEVIDEKLVTKSDILLLQKDILALKQDMLTLEERLTYKLTIRLGSMLASSIGIIYVLIKFGH